MAVVKLGSAEEAKMVMENKKKLKGGRISIEKELSWEEKRTKWRLQQIAIKEVTKGRRVWVGKEKLRIEGTWWIWDKKSEELRDGLGRRLEE